MKRGGLSSLVGGLLLGICLAAVALWRGRAASHDRAPDQQAAAPAPVPSTITPAPRPLPSPAAPAPRRPHPLDDRDVAALDEARLMARLRAAAESSPAQAIGLAREGNRRWPRSADAPERTSILIHALVATGRSAEARGEAERMVNQAPDSPWVRDVERFTGAHRHRNVRVNDAGVIEYYDAPNK